MKVEGSTKTTGLESSGLIKWAMPSQANPIHYILATPNHFTFVPYEGRCSNSDIFAIASSSHRRQPQIYLSDNIYLCPAERVRRFQLPHIPNFVAIEATNIVPVVEYLMNPNRKSDPSSPPCNINASKRRCGPLKAGDDSQVPVHVACVGSIDSRCVVIGKERKVNGGAWVQRRKALWKD